LASGCWSRFEFGLEPVDRLDEFADDRDERAHFGGHRFGDKPGWFELVGAQPISVALSSMRRWWPPRRNADAIFNTA
jgi:hypothetical protein